MLIPIAHEDLRGRRWPYVSIVLILLNTLIFVATHGRMEREQDQTAEVRLHILILSARFPDAEISGDAREMVDVFKRDHPAIYERLANSNRELADPWEAQLLVRDWSPADINAEMASLCTQFDQNRRDSIAWNYAFHPYHPTAVSYITAGFLHVGWLHLIFNMWFLWLAGTVLEDAWGRLVYPIFYLLSGALALVVHAAVFPGSLVPVLGASGAIAGLMGGFLARFPKTRIKLLWFWGLPFWFRPVKFFVPAYILLPIWLGIQLVWGAVSGSSGGVAYWAHIGGFAFGVAGAFLLRSTGIEQAMDQAIEAKVTWEADPHIVHATEFLEQGQFDASIAELQQMLKEAPDSIEGYELLLKAQDKKQDFAAQKQTVAALCRLNVTSGDLPAAMNYYELYLNLGGDKLPRGVWLELCRYLESQQNWERAASEYERFAEKNTKERASVPALVSAARICLTRLNRIPDALRLYRAAQASPVPHLDLEATIHEGLRQCEATDPTPTSPVGTYIGNS
jgi:membrane associated rhomboid family serine protease